MDPSCEARGVKFWPEGREHSLPAPVLTGEGDWALLVLFSPSEHSSVLPDGGQDTSEDLSFVPGDDSTR